jgi:hypothetical protein
MWKGYITFHCSGWIWMDERRKEKKKGRKEMD